MIKRVVTAGITMALSVSVLITPLSAEAAVTPGKTYNDTTGHWSQQVVEETSAIGLMKGYPGGYFKPEGLMSRLEAISVIIRAMGLEDQALKTKAEGSGITMPSGMTWGQGFLVMAVQKGLLSKEYVPALKYNDPITRAEVATLVAVALNIKGDPAKLTYVDNSSILELYKPYVAAVTEKNIMNGLGENKFGPNQSMKRGQMAALMATVSRDGWFKYGSDRLISGTVVSLNSTSGLLVLKKTDGTVVQKILADKPALFNGSSAAALADIKSGTPVVAGISDSGAIQYIEITNTVAVDNSQTPDSTVTGKVITAPGAAGSSITIAGGTSSGKSYTLTTGVLVKDNAGTTSLAALTAGNYVTAQIKNSQIYSIQILPTVSTEGTIVSVDSGSLKMTDNSGGSYNFTMKSGETIISGGTGSISLSDLRAGDKIKVTSSMGQILEINVSGEDRFNGDYVEGEITSLKLGSSAWITVKDKNGNKKTYDITSNTEITKNGHDINRDEVMIGAEVTVEFNGSEALKIEITNDEDITVEGEVVKVDTSNDRITINQDSDNEFRLDVDKDCYFKNQASSSRIYELGDIKVDYMVQITLTNSDATKITVLDDQNANTGTVEGEVTDLILGSSPRITVKNGGGSTARYNITNSTDITKNGNNIYKEDIMIGAEAKLWVDGSTADKIQITNDEDITVKGQVVSVDTHNDRITIEQVNGERFRLDVNRDCSFRDYVDSDVSELGDVKSGWQVELILGKGEVTYLKVTEK